MALIKTVNNISPKISKSVYIADNATIIGDVFIGENSSVWFNTVIRGDVNSIVIGDNVNIQDGVVIHCTYKKSKVTLGNNVSIGHNAIVHGCKIHDNVLVGMGSIVMDHCEIGSNSIVAAGAVVIQNTIVPPGTVFAGIPAKKIKDIDINLQKNEIERIAQNYIMYSSWFKT